MLIEPIDNTCTRYAIPLQQISETRVRFGHLRITFEVDLETQDAWGGLEAASRAFGRAGLAPLTLHLTRGGTISCKLADTPYADLSALDDALCSSTCLRLVGWTTMIESGD